MTPHQHFDRRSHENPFEMRSTRRSHSVATHLLENGVDREGVRDWLGHRQVTTTALYLHATDVRKRKAAAKLRLIQIHNRDELISQRWLRSLATMRWRRDVQLPCVTLPQLGRSLRDHICHV